MPKFRVTVCPVSTPVYPGVRKIGPSDLKDALAKGTEDFLTMPAYLIQANCSEGANESKTRQPCW